MSRGLHRLTGYPAAQFAADYAARSGITLEQLQRHRHVVECDCPYDRCPGWAMVPLDFLNDRGIDAFPSTVAWP